MTNGNKIRIGTGDYACKYCGELLLSRQAIENHQCDRMVVAKLESDNARLRQQVNSLVEAWRNFKADKLDEYQTYRIENWEDFAATLNAVQAETEAKP